MMRTGLVLLEGWARVGVVRRLGVGVVRAGCGCGQGWAGIRGLGVGVVRRLGMGVVRDGQVPEGWVWTWSGLVLGVVRGQGVGRVRELHATGSSWCTGR